MRISPQKSGYFTPRAVAGIILVSASIFLGTLSVNGTIHNGGKVAAGPVQAALASTLPAANSGPGWSVVNSPNTTEQQLLGSTCVSATDCWAVGYYVYIAFSNISQTLIEHWDGNSWTIVASPNAMYQGTYIIPNRLTSVSCTSTSDCWAVGYAHNTSQFPSTYITVIEHWNGTSWSVVNSPNPSSIQNQLKSVACSSPTDCWAVGNYKTNNNLTQT